MFHSHSFCLISIYMTSSHLAGEFQMSTFSLSIFILFEFSSFIFDKILVTFIYDIQCLCFMINKKFSSNVQSLVTKEILVIYLAIHLKPTNYLLGIQDSSHFYLSSVSSFLSFSIHYP